jgi:hypothetical protein
MRSPIIAYQTGFTTTLNTQLILETKSNSIPDETSRFPRASAVPLIHRLMARLLIRIEMNFLKRTDKAPR